MRTLAAIAVLSFTPVWAQNEPRLNVAAFVRATGESTVEVKPDEATIDIGVVTQAANASAASAQNAGQVTAVLNRMKTEIGNTGEIHTTGYSVSPNYSYPTNGSPKIVGYTASNTVRVKLHEIERVGSVIDAATGTGANNVHGIQFSVKDEQSVRAQALQEAARKARSSGEAMAAALGLRVVRVRSAEAGQPATVRPMMAMERMQSASRMPTPVEPGNVQIGAVVTVTLEVAP